MAVCLFVEFSLLLESPSWCEVFGGAWSLWFVMGLLCNILFCVSWRGSVPVLSHKVESDDCMALHNMSR
jgi:hypothetical protein